MGPHMGPHELSYAKELSKKRVGTQWVPTGSPRVELYKGIIKEESGDPLGPHISAVIIAVHLGNVWYLSLV